ncbi:MAG: hypothetical protein LBN37_06565 [Bacteroidales bacterium]|nr:hypothetical protein [Bacteroidales bacterium]
MISANQYILNRILKMTGLPSLVHLATKLNVNPNMLSAVYEGKQKFNRKLTSAIMSRFANLNLSSKWLLSGNKVIAGSPIVPHVNIPENKSIKIRKRAEKKVTVVKKPVLPVLPVQPVQPVLPVQSVQPIPPVQPPIVVKEIVKPVALPVSTPSVDATIEELNVPWLSSLLSCQNDLLKNNSKLLSMNQYLVDSIIKLTQK